MKMVKDMSLRFKLLGAMIMTSLIVVLVLSGLALQSARKNLEKNAVDKLTTIRKEKAKYVENMFQTFASQVETFSESKSIIQAMTDLKLGFAEVDSKNAFNKEKKEELLSGLENYYNSEFLPRLQKRTLKKYSAIDLMPSSESGKLLQSFFISTNRNPVGEKSRLTESSLDNSFYSKAHAEFHPIIKNYLEKFGYYDIFLIDDKTGDIVYSVYKETDFATNLASGAYANSGLAEVFNQVKMQNSTTFVGISSFKSYIPSYEMPAAFMASPIVKDGKRIGVLAAQIPLDKVNELMTFGKKWEENGMGYSGDVFLVGQDKTLRSESRHLIEEPDHLFEILNHQKVDSEIIQLIKMRNTAVLLQEINSESVEDALFKKKTNTRVGLNFHNEKVLASYAPIKVLGNDWAIVAEMDIDEAFAQINEMEKQFALFGLLVLLLAGGIAYVFARSLIRPISQAANVAEQFKQGQESARIQVNSKDEIGRLGLIINETFDVSLENKKEVQKAMSEARQSAAKANSALEGSQTAFITCDRNLHITYVNPASIKMFKENITEMRKVFSDFNPDTLVGRNIDQFHKVPSVQREILSRAENLPYSTEIKVGKLSFQLNVSAMKDSEGVYVGNTLEWKNITQLKQKEIDVSRMQSMVEGSSVAVMLCDRNYVITYANPRVVQLLAKHEAKIRTVLPRFDINNIVGKKIDEFHMSPEKQHNILSNIALSPYKTDISFVGLSFGLNAIALVDSEGNHIGTAVEWTDNNARENYRNEVSKIIESAANGVLSVRGDVSQMDQVYAPMLSGINDVLEAVVAPINELQTKLSRVSDGDLTAYVDGNYRGDYALLKDALNSTLDSLNSILGQVQNSASQIGTGARELSSSSQTVSQGATESAASLEQITASMTEMAEQTRQNAENASQANQLASSARDSAENGNTQMRKMVGAMKEISESSQNISKIIKVIDEIAFQTNLLALNAAVEAARAGVHGKGFAVVAEEVRNLAARSAKAARETTDMIENSISKVNSGSEIATKTQEALEEIVNVVGKATDLVSEINAASNEQAIGISQVNQGLSQLDAVTQQNSAAAEESASASEELAGQSSQLQDMLTRFKIKGGEAHFQQPSFGKSYSTPMISSSRPSSSFSDSSSSKVINPNDIISLDDDEFGKF